MLLTGHISQMVDEVCACDCYLRPACLAGASTTRNEIGLPFLFSLTLDSYTIQAIKTASTPYKYCDLEKVYTENAFPSDTRILGVV